MTLNGILALGNPSAVTGLVVLDVILSANRQAFWTRPHISQEIDEFSPAAAHPDTFGSVPFEIVLSRTVASAHHMSPDSVGETLSRLGRMPVNKLSGSGAIHFCAATTLCSPGTKFLRRHNSFRSAIASTKPSASRFAHASVAQNKPATKTLSGQFDPLHGVRI